MTRILDIMLMAVFFLAGMFAGSFLDILIYKIPRKLKIFKPYAICYSCKEKLGVLNAFPLLSFILGRGRCNSCSTKLRVQNILVEVLVGLLFLLVYLLFGLSLKTISGVILVGVLVTISFIDWEFMIIPNLIVLPFTLVGLALSILGNISKWWHPLAFSAGAFFFMLIIHLIYPKGMGMGDVKLALMLGAFLVKNVVAGLFLGFLAGSMAGIIFILLKKKTLKQFIPFGPFISIGGLVAFFAGDYIARWYTGYF